MTIKKINQAALYELEAFTVDDITYQTMMPVGTEKQFAYFQLIDEDTCNYLNIDFYQLAIESLCS